MSILLYSVVDEPTFGALVAVCVFMVVMEALDQYEALSVSTAFKSETAIKQLI